MAQSSYLNADGVLLGPSGAPTRWLSSKLSHQTLVGDDGNDLFWDSGNGNTLIGGLGSNVFNVVGSTDQVVVPAGGGVNTIISWTVAYSLPENVANLTLNYAGQTGTGNDGANILLGGAGAETLDGGGGSDVLVAGSGADTFIVRAGYAGSSTIVGFKPATDFVQLVGFAGLVTMVQVAASLSQVGADAVLALSNQQQLVIRNTVASQLTAANFSVPADSSGLILNGLGQVLPVSGPATAWPSTAVAGQTLTGDAGNDVFWGAKDGDTFVAGMGSNVFNLQSSADVVVAPRGGGVNTAVLWAWNHTLALPANVQNLTLENPGQVGIGSTGNNIIRGGAGVETIDGHGGSDALVAGTGPDSFIIARSYAGSTSIAGFKPGVDQVELTGFTNFRSFANVGAALQQVGTDAVLALGNGSNLVFRGTAAASLSAADFRLPENLTGLRQTFGASFATFSSSPDGSTGVWQTSLAYGSRTLAASSQEIEYYNDASTGTNPFSLDSGGLDITAMPQAGPGGATWSSGVITTQKSFSQLYGVFEMKAELPAGTGMWPAFWMLPANGSWPPELDVLEKVGGDPGLIHQSTRDLVGGVNVVTANTVRVGDTSAGFHTYAVDWEPDTVTFYYDGNATVRMATPADMHVPMYMLANLAVGGPNSWGGAPDATTPAVDHLVIAGIRVFASSATPGLPAPTPGDGSAVPITPVTVGGPLLSAAQFQAVTAMGGDGTVVPIRSALASASGDQIVVASKAALSVGALPVITSFQDANDATSGQHDFLALTGFSAQATIVFDHLGTSYAGGPLQTDPAIQYYSVTDTDGFSAQLQIHMSDGLQHLGSHSTGFV